jgi:Family of unknown function (DUF6200)
MNEKNAVTVVEGEAIPPIVINLGKAKGKKIKDLKRGRGKLMDEVLAAIEQVRANLGEDAPEGRLLPVVLIYEKKPKRIRRGLFGF